MLTRSGTNRFIKYFAYGVLGLTVIVSIATGLNLTDEYGLLHPLRWLVAAALFIGGTFNALLLFAISEALGRLQEIEYNTERTYKSVEHIERQASS